MPINQDIQKFYKSAVERDFSRDFLFRVTQLQLAGVEPLLDDELVYIRTASLPGRNITNIPTPFMGLPFNIPGGATYAGSDAYSVNFYLDANSRLRNYLERASREIFDDVNSTGNYSTPGVENYIELLQLNKQLDPIPGGKYKLIGASIRNVEPIEYSIAEGTGNWVQANATIAYHFYTVPA
jgi:hypothetical protein